jgi:hypothetical protein
VWPLVFVASIGMMAITEPESPAASGDARRHVGAAGLPRADPGTVSDRTLLGSASRLIAGVEEGEEAVGEPLEPITTQVVEHVAPIAARLEHAGVAQLA